VTTTSGYSGKTLAAKMGLRAGMRLAALRAPAHYEKLIEEAIGEIDVSRFKGALPRGRFYDIVHLFADRTVTLAELVPSVLGAVKQGGALWVSWPKKSSPLFVDLTEDGVRRVVLPTGFVDVKVAAVDQDWSALKFLRRKAAAR
jgi:hypothetical protein